MSRSSRQFLLVIVGALLTTCFGAGTAAGHEMRPAYLELKETAGGKYSIVWRTPVISQQRLPVTLKLPVALKETKPPNLRGMADSLIERRWVDAGPNGLAGQRIDFVGLDATTTNVLVRLEMLDGKNWTTIVHPPQPWWKERVPAPVAAICSISRS